MVRIPLIPNKSVLENICDGESITVLFVHHLLASVVNVVCWHSLLAGLAGLKRNKRVK